MARQSILSPHWYRVAQLHPRLAKHVRVQRQAMRRGVDYVLHDSASGRMVRLNESAYRLAGRMNGDATLDEIWREVMASEGELAPTQAETIGVLASLVERGVVRCETTPDSLDVLDAELSARRKSRRAAFNPMALRIPLGNPGPWLDRLAPRLPKISFVALALTWLVLAAWALASVSDQGAALYAHMREMASSPRSLLLLWVVYPVVKALHELAHVAALRAFGGNPREVGITLMMGMPVPFVDASDADAFPERRRRMLVSAAGILAELAMAAMAALLWSAAQPGIVRDGAMTVLLICTVSTLVFNGNPLMRMDGYHILADAMGMPNLAQRSRELMREYVSRFFTGAAPRGGHGESRAERSGLLAYGLASTLYRFMVSATLVLWAASLSTLFGSLLAVVFAIGLLGAPAWEALRYLTSSPALARNRLHHVGRATGIATAFALAIAFVPVPMRVNAQGVVWVPPEAEMRAGEDGFVERVLVSDGEKVVVGQPLMVLIEPSLVAQREQAQSKLTALDVEFTDVVLRQPARAMSLDRQIDGARAELQRLQARQEALVIRSGAVGYVSVPRTANWPERFVKKGTVVSHVVGDDLMTVRAVVEQGDIELIRRSLKSASVRLADRPDVQWSALLVRDTPSATRHLPNAALGENGGGSIAIDPSDKQGQTALRPMHVLDLKIPSASLDVLGGRLGTRAHVAFDLPAQPLLDQGMHALRQVFLRYFTREV